ncbi:hypothetical protein [Agromyces lapidis]|uniref:Uncharacterized protein n=1 Tax=Agromyces lapidis TaxID=279574 RepID=A0ABV5ST43_9MICO|nr:hypothetical protein [Agromyces lapidis]
MPIHHSKGTTAVKWVKRIVLGLVVVFAAFYLITRPEDAANAVQGAVDAVFNAAGSVVTFFTSLSS